MIKKMELENFKSHKNSTIEFEEGYNVLVGKIGSGKSSIIEAIAFALFGTTQNITSKKVQVKDMILNKPYKADFAKVKMWFKESDKEYAVERNIFPTKSSQAKLYEIIGENEKLIAGPKPSDVNEEIEKILNLNIDVYMRANYSEQNQIDMFLKLPAQQRKILFDNLFGIDFYENQAVFSRQIGNKIKSHKIEIEKKAIEFNAILKNYDIKEIKDEIEKVEVEIKEKELKNTNIKKEKEDVDEKYNQLILDEKKYEELNSMHNILKGQINQISFELQNFEKMENVDEKIKEIKNQIEMKVKNKNELSNEKNKIEVNRDINNKILREIEENAEKFKEIIARIEGMAKETLISNIDKIEKEIANKKEKNAELRNKIEEIEKSNKELEKADAKCPVCEQNIDQEHRLKLIKEREENTNKYNLEIQNNIKEIQKLEEKHNYEKKQNQFYNENHFKVEEIKNKLSKKEELLSEKKKIEDKYKKSCIELEKEEKEIKEIELETKKLEKQKEMEEKNLRLEKLKIQVTELTKEIINTKFDKDKINNIRTKKIKIEEEEKYFSTIIYEKNKYLKELKDKLERTKEITQKIKKIEDELNKINLKIEDLSIFSNICKKTQEDVRNLMIKNINEIFMDLWPRIYPYNDFNSVELKIVDGDYKIQLNFNNEYKRVLDEFVSGGERSSIALTLRLAMSLVMKNKLNTLILDEPTHNLDKNAVLNLSKLFNEHIPKFMDQIIVVTHDQLLENHAKNIFFINRDKENDSPTEIERKL
jgi:DNA repair protein SbcC/Rad50